MNHRVSYAYELCSVWSCLDNVGINFTFSFTLRALMILAARVSPEEFSIHLCTWPKRPLQDQLKKKRKGKKIREGKQNNNF